MITLFGGGGGGGYLMQCGHPAKMLGHCVLVCSLDCDLQRKPVTCSQCQSAHVQKHDFGSSPHGRYHNEKFPNAIYCLICRHVTLDGGTLR